MDVLALIHFRSARCFALAFILLLSLAAAAPAAADVPVTASNYGSPTVTTDANGTTVEVGGSPAGLDYRATLDPARTYQVTFSGARLAGSFFLRITRGAGKPDYVQAPGGSASYVISNTTSIEFLFYADRPAQYRISDFAVDDCTATCKTDADLKAEVLAGAPGLADALAGGDTYTAARAILHWASPRTPFWDAAGSAAGYVDTSGMDASDIYYNHFAPAHEGVLCGGASDFLRKLLTLFSIPSFTINFGIDEDGLNHVTVVIEVPDQTGATSYRLLDPTIDGEILIGWPPRTASIPELLELWRAGRSDALHVAAPNASLGERRVVAGPGFPTLRCADYASSSSVCSADGFFDEMDPALRAHGYAEGAAGLIELLGTTDLHDVADRGVPDAFQTMHATFKAAVENNESDVHVAALPDVDAPTTQIDPAPPLVSHSSDVAVSFRSAEAGARHECRLDDGDWAACESPVSYRGLSDGRHHVDVRASDPIGNVARTPARASFWVDTRPPVTPVAPAGPAVPVESAPAPAPAVEAPKAKTPTAVVPAAGSLLTALRRGVTVSVLCPARCSVVVEAGVDMKTAIRLGLVRSREAARAPHRRFIWFARTRAGWAASGTRRITVRLPAAERRRMAARAFTLVLRTSVFDGDLPIPQISRIRLSKRTGQKLPGAPARR